ncbi:MAG: restriction endonuclease subunit S [Phycisphaerae bacterium]|nr:restriction endonuclease subunit S [Phycisphaerae bacterium]
MTGLAVDSNHALKRRFRPYPDYRDSGVEWLGQVPERWNITSIKRLARKGYRTFTDGDWIESPFIKDEGVRLIQTGNVGIGVYREQGFRYISQETFGAFHCTEVQPKDVLVCRLAEPVGRACLAPDLGVRMITSVDVCILKTRDGIDARYVVYALSNPQYLSWVDSLCRGGTRDRISRSMLGSLHIQLPPLPEQRAIAVFLDRETARIDELVAKKQRLIELLAEKRTALISHAVTKGLNPDAPMKDSGVEWLGKVPERWRIKKLKFLADGGVENGLFKKKQFFGAGVRLVNVFDVYREDFLVDETTLERVEADGVESRRYAVQPGDVFFVRSSLKLEGVGKSACMLDLSEPAVFECHLVRMRPSRDAIVPRFLINFLNSVPATNRLIALANQVTMTTIDQDKFKSLEVPVPPLQEQEAISELLSEHTRRFFALASSVNDAIDRLREYRSALISAAVTGKIDVREVASVVPARRANVHFHRCVLAAEIVDRHLDTPRFGRLKLQKLLILAERHLGLDEIQSQPVRAAAGPFDNRMMRAIQAQLKRQKWFDPTKTERGTKYVPMEKHGGHREYFERYWGDKQEPFDALMALLKPMTTQQAEIVATLYMAWNDFVIAGAEFDDERIVSEVLNNWDESKQSIEPDRWRRAVTWMREKGLIPCGYGSPTRKGVADAN